MRLTGCPNPVGVFVDESGVSVLAPCGKRSCPWCGEVYKKRFLDRVAFGHAQNLGGRKIYFVTLTLTRRRKKTVNGRKVRFDSKDIMLFYKRWRTYINKVGKIKFEYVWVKDFTEKAMVHLHILVDYNIPKDILRHAWYLATGKTSFITDIRGVDNEIINPAGYMAKYFGKSMVSKFLRSGERFFTFSRGWQYKLPKMSKGFKLLYNPEISKVKYINGKYSKSIELFAWFLRRGGKYLKAEYKGIKHKTIMWDGKNIISKDNIKIDMQRKRKNLKYIKSLNNWLVG